jgi:sigma-B regulation protein RsbU (phosphoserine phosphatase)
LDAGDLLLIYTDGVTEAANLQGEEFGVQRLAQAAWRARSLPANQLLRSVRQELESFTQGVPLPDDTTLVVFRVTA